MFNFVLTGLSPEGEVLFLGMFDRLDLCEINIRLGRHSKKDDSLYVDRHPKGCRKDLRTSISGLPPLTWLLSSSILGLILDLHLHLP